MPFILRNLQTGAILQKTDSLKAVSLNDQQLQYATLNVRNPAQSALIALSVLVGAYVASIGFDSLLGQAPAYSPQNVIAPLAALAASVYAYSHRGGWLPCALLLLAAFQVVFLSAFSLWSGPLPQRHDLVGMACACIVATSLAAAWGIRQSLLTPVNEVMFSRSDLTHGRFVACKFTACSFDRTRLSLVSLVDSEFREVDYSRSDCSGMLVSSCIFDRCEFVDADLSSAIARYVRFTNCSFERTDMRGIRFHCVQFLHCSFVGTDFRGVDLSKVNLRGGSLDLALLDSETKLPIFVAGR